MSHPHFFRSRTILIDKFLTSLTNTSLKYVQDVARFENVFDLLLSTLGISFSKFAENRIQGLWSFSVTFNLNLVKRWWYYVTIAICKLHRDATALFPDWKKAASSPLIFDQIRSLNIFCCLSMFLNPVLLQLPLICFPNST